MKKFAKWSSLCSLLLMLAMLLASCGSSSKSYAAETAVAGDFYEAPAEEENGFYDDAYSGESSLLNASNSNEAVSQSEAKWIYTGYLEVWTSDFNKGSRCIEKLVEDYGGYFESRKVWSYDEYSNADYTIRVASDKYEAFMNAVSGSDTLKVVSQTSDRENISETYYDIVNRLNTLQIKLDRLNDLMEQAENMEDLITIENAIADVEYQIESYTGTLNHYDSLIEYSTVTISLSEVSNVEEALEPTLGQRIAAGFSSGVERLGINCENLLVWVVSNIFGILILALIIVVVVLVIHRKHKRKMNNTGKKKSKDVLEGADEKTE